ncbi:putative monovalent cation/H+ antiporter subunit A [Devosia sp. XJ19-1]|uniref:Monovalent cation/H+ antiporter subunit A n=1 Tax=Devosia ureilytica TaxID=2952754 RepID=A0A9Q4FRW3_9HYPH|nr:putative monovalent cation/H+ antiporter subunit A [Devosia ureilytica]MCP8884293.1 putative monovalent cation/H+ antiporter subunit A [Devosia ureilytica]MCP8887901.1 putative monovalent cation/H+ antiporter subunit A [Devosia ureilytica]
MGPSLDASIGLVAVAPFVAAILAPFIHRFAGAYAGWILAIVPASIFVFLLSFAETVVHGHSVASSMEWIPAYGINLSFFIDGLSLIFALTISGIGTLIILYSGAYLAGHPHQGRFLGFMLAFMGAMLGLVLADSLLSLFLFWELTSVTSFLLIGFDHSRQAARRGAIQALVITNIGGMFLLAGAILVHQIAGVWEMSAVRDMGEVLRGSGLYLVVLICFLGAAFTKSAQFPLHFWLPNAMEAPTPVSAFLHSATMVQAGVYLLARMTPSLGGTGVWTNVLVSFGAVTLIWGALGALKETDLKQILAQTTIASLGLLVLLIGLGSTYAIAGMVVYFVAHAFYKAGLFMVAGAVDHEAGTREITDLGGLADKMPVTFIGAALAALSMVGLPMTVGYFAKEEMYLGLMSGQWTALLVLAVLVVGNAMLAGVALLVMIRPFLGEAVPTPKKPHEAPIAMLAGPVILGAAGIVAGILPDWLGHDVLVPGSSAILAQALESHLTLALDVTSPLLWLSALTWGLGVLVYRQADAIRTLLRRFDNAIGWTADTVFDAVMFGLIRFAGAVTRFLHHGQLEFYLVVVFGAMAVAMFGPMLAWGGLDWIVPTAELGDWSQRLVPPDLEIYEWGILGLAVLGLIAVLVAPSRLIAILSLGVQGTAVALIFLLFGAPDLAFTQLMVEILSVVILTFVMTRLRLDQRDHRPFEDWSRDGALAAVCGLGVSLLLMLVLNGTLDTRLSDFFTATSVPIAHGHNIVNVILVDYRGFDTLGEIAVVMGAGMAILALLRRQKKVVGPLPEPAKPKRVRKPRKAAS